MSPAATPPRRAGSAAKPPAAKAKALAAKAKDGVASAAPRSGAQQTLSAIALFKKMPQAAREGLEKRCRWRNYAAEEQIIDRENDSQDVFFVVSGVARVVIYSSSGREVSFDDIQVGGVFGELSAIDGRPRSASVIARTDSQIASLPAPVFCEMLEAHPSVAMILMRRLAAMVRGSTDRILDLSTLGAHNRIYAELLRAARESDPQAFAKKQNVATLRPIPVHSDIGARVSTARETVARVLNDLARKNIVTREDDALMIRDVARLTSMVHEFHVA